MKPLAAAFQTPLPLSARHQHSLTAPKQPQARTRTAPNPTIKLAVSPPQRATTPAKPQTYPPGVVPYPTPTAVPGERASKIKPCSSIPQAIRVLSQTPHTANLPALVDLHHTPSACITYSQMHPVIDRLTAGLFRIGLAPHTTVSFFSENSYRWFLLDQAIMTLACAAAVRGVAAPLPELLYIYNHSRSQALFVENASVLERVVAAGLDRSAIKFVVVLFGEVSSCQQLLPGVKVYSYDQLLLLGENPKPEEIKPRATRQDVATVLYTSGTTGNPKGVPLTHENILSQLEDISLGKYDPVPGEVFVSVLPCWHVFERTAAYWTLSKGMTLVYSNKRRFRDDLAKHRPHMLISVPRVFENLHAAIMAKLQNASPLRKALFAFFLNVSLAFVYARRRLRGETLESKRNVFQKAMDAITITLLTPLYALANLLVWKKIRAGTGSRLRICLSGGGSIAGYLEDFFECAGIQICVGYGLTETSPVIANRFGEKNIRGSTGMQLPRAFVKIVDRYTGKPVKQGEQGILHVRGPYTFGGYLYNPDATEKAFDSEGYFDTGDLAYNAPGGDIVITGRSKDLIVLSNGENIEPGPIEDALLASPMVDQVMLVGQDERALGALVVPKLEVFESEGIIDDSYRKRVEPLVEDAVNNRDILHRLEAELMEKEDFMNALDHEVQALNRERPNYSPVDRVNHIRVVLAPFSVENGMMTQTLKVKKNVVSEAYSKEIADMYRHK